MSTRRLYLPTVPISFFVLFFGLSAYLSAGIIYDPTLVGNRLAAALVSVAVYLALVYLVRSRDLARYVAVISIQLATLFALVFISQFRYQEYPELTDFIRGLGNATSFLPDLTLGYLHPNAVATTLEVALPMALAFALSRRRMAVRVIGGVTALILLYAIILTYSRGAYLGLAGAAVALVVAFILYRLPRPLAYSAVIAGMGLGVLVILALLNLDPAQPLPILNRPVDPRLELYHNSLYLARDYVYTGIGLGDTFAATYSRYALLIQPLFVSYASNLLISIWLNQGLLGVVAFIGIILTYYRYVAYVIRRALPSAMFHGLWLGVTATLVHGLFDARQYSENAFVLPVLFIAMGLTVAYGQVALREEGAWLSVRRWLRGAVLVFAPLVLVAVILGLALRPTLTAAWYTNQGALEETRADFAPRLTDMQRFRLGNTAADWYDRALAEDPDYPPANRRLGNLRVVREQFADAIPLLERAYAGEPTNPAAIKGLGLAYVWVGRTEDAAALLKRLPNPDEMANELYTWGYFRSGEEQNQPLLAAYAWETAEYMGDAGNVEVWMQIAGFYEQANAPDRARAAYAHIIEVDPNYNAARDALAALDG